MPSRAPSPSRSSSGSPAPETDLSVELARNKRKISALENDLKNARGLVKKRPISLRTIGRGIAKIVSPFVDIPTLVMEADRRDDAALSSILDPENIVVRVDSDELTDDEKAEAQRTLDRDYASYLALDALIPGFKKTIDVLSSEELSDYYARLGDGCTDGRGDDIFSMCRGMADFLNKAGASPPLDPSSREGRGHLHNLCGMFLCPAEWNWADLGVRANIQNGHEDYDASNRFFLLCLYAGFKANENDLEKGFLKSALLVKAFKFIFTSPSSARDIVLVPAEDTEPTDNAPPAKKRRTKAPTTGTVAARLRMEHVTPRAIAYVCVMVVFALTDAPRWDDSYDGFNYRGFYNFIVDFFEDTETVEDKKRVKELLKWWDRQIFPHASAAANNSSGNISRTKLTAQRRARAAAAVPAA